MKIICGYKKENYEFIVEKEFRKTFTRLKSKNDFFSFEIISTKRKEWEYFIEINYKNIKLTSLGIRRDYYIRDKMTDICLRNDRYDITTKNEKGEGSYYICKKGSFKKVDSLDKYHDEEDKLEYFYDGDIKLTKAIQQKILYYKKQFQSAFKKVKNVEALINAIETVLDVLVEYRDVCYEEFWKDFDVVGFIELCVLKEKNVEYAKEHISFKKFQAKYNNKFPTNLSAKDIEEIFNEKLTSYNEENKNNIFSDIDINNYSLKPEDELNIFFENVFEEIDIVSKERKKIELENSIKLKYFEKIKRNEYIDMNSCVDLDDFKKNIVSFFNKSIVINEENFVKELKIFLQDYDDFQKYFDKYNKHFSGKNIVFDLTNELEEKFKSYEKKEINLTEEEKIHYEYIYTKIKEDINNTIYIKNTNKLKPTFLELPKYIEWAKSFFSWLEDEKIIFNNKINQDNLKLLSIMPKPLLKYE